MKIQKRVLLPLLLFLFLLLLSPAHAEDSKSFLWKVQSDTSTAYILGSIHAMKEDIYPLDRKIDNAFQESGSLVLEIDLNLDLNKVLAMMMQSAMYQNDDSLKKHLTPGTYELAAAAMKKSGLDIRMFEKCKPWFAAVMIETLELTKMGFNPELGIDKHFFNKAGNKKILALETPEYQIGLFSQFKDDEQEAFLLATIKGMDLLEKEMTVMVDAWKAGNAAKMDSMLSGNMAKYPGINQTYEKLVFQRNRNMAAKIEDYLKTRETYFIVVGAAHLVGERGIIELLRDRGYSVKQM
jgi:uncharacterized protein